jgi:hypothetical protein
MDLFTSAAITSFGIVERRPAKRPFNRVRYCFSIRLCDVLLLPLEVSVLALGNIVLLGGYEGLVVRSWRYAGDR